MQTPMIYGKALAKSVEQELQVRVQRIKDETTVPVLLPSL